MIFVTGDTHADFKRFSTKAFDDQKDLTREDRVIICGDFGGVWYDNENERYWLDWLAEKPFTICFVDGNHENFDRMYGDEFPVIDYCGGKAHKIRDNIYHLMRGYVFEFEGKKFFCFGGARSHDIRDGILHVQDFKTVEAFKKEYKKWIKQGRQFRINHVSWWEQEMPSQEEMDRGEESLREHDYKVDFVIAHCLPHVIATVCSGGYYKPDDLTLYFNKLLDNGLEFQEWHCGHYHKTNRVLGCYYIHYYDIMRL